MIKNIPLILNNLKLNKPNNLNLTFNKVKHIFLKINHILILISIFINNLNSKNLILPLFNWKLKKSETKIKKGNLIYKESRIMTKPVLILKITLLSVMLKIVSLKKIISNIILLKFKNHHITTLILYLPMKKEKSKQALILNAKVLKYHLKLTVPFLNYKLRI